MKVLWIIGTSALLAFIGASLALWMFSGLLSWTIGNPEELRMVIDTGIPKLILTIIFTILIAKPRFEK